jgi:predicted ArsR family transcriptional regulator
MTKVNTANKAKSPKELLRNRILEICSDGYLSLREISNILGSNKHTMRAGYIYPMVKEGLLDQEYPAGTKSKQRYRSRARKSNQM